MIDVIVVDDEQTTREGISASINWSACGLRLHHSVGSAMEALELLEELLPGIMILDIKMPVGISRAGIGKPVVVPEK